MTRIVGIDPGSLKTGYGIIQVSANIIQYVASGVIKLNCKAGLPNRLDEIFTCIRQIIVSYEPQDAAIESVFMHKNASSALTLGHARGTAIVALTYSSLSVAEYTARQIKQAVVGYGNADKQQVQHMVKSLLCLNKAPSVDAADALAVAICHYQAVSGQLGIFRANGFRRGRIKT